MSEIIAVKLNHKEKKERLTTEGTEGTEKREKVNRRLKRSADPRLTIFSS